MKKILLTGLVVMCMMNTLLGQGTIQGLITDRTTGDPIPGAHIVVSGSYKKTITGTKGEFRLKGLPADDYKIVISHISYIDTIVEVQLNNTLILNISLPPDLVITDPVIISAIRAHEESPTTQTTILKEEIESSNLGWDIPYLLGTTPSVVTTSDAGTGIGYTGMRIRGTDMNRINVTINGIPLNDAESHSVYWVDLPDFASSVESVQIQRGVGTSTNGASAFGASINIETDKINTLPYAETHNSFGSFNTMKNSLSFGSGLINKRITIDGRISRIHSDGYIDRGWSDLSSYFLSGSYIYGKTVVKFLTWSGKEVTYQAWGGVDPLLMDSIRTFNPMGIYTDENGRTRYYRNQVDDYLQNHYQFHFSRRPTQFWTINTAIHLTKGEGFYEEYKEDASYSDYGFSNPIIGMDTLITTDLVRRKWLDNNFYGITFSTIYDDNKKITFTLGGALNRYDGDHFGTVIWMQNSGDVGIGDKWYNSNGTKTDFNLYSKVLYLTKSGATLYGDLQYRYINHTIDGIDDDLRDISQEHNFHFFNPKAGISWQFRDGHSSYFSLAVANREPNRSNFTDADPSAPVPVPETLYNLELGHKANFSKISLEANLFGMYYNNQLVLTGEINDVGSPVMTNVKTSYRAGFEMSVGWIVLPKLTWEMNAAISKHQIVDFTAYIDDWDTWSQREEQIGNTTIAFSPEFIGNSIIKWTPVKQGALYLVSQYVSEQFLDNTANNSRKLDAWFVNSIRLQYSIKTKFFKEISFSLMLNNILNRKYVTNGWVYRYYYNGNHETMTGLYPQSGFNMMGGVMLKI